MRISRAQSILVSNGIVALSGFAIAFIGGPFLLLFQMYYGLREADWISFSLLGVLCRNTDFYSWVVSPKDWIGLHALFVPIFRFIPSGFVAFLVGGLIIHSTEDAEALAAQAEMDERSRSASAGVEKKPM